MSKIDFNKHDLERNILSWFDGLVEALKIPMPETENEAQQKTNAIFDALQADINAAISKAKEEFKKTSN